MAVCHGIVKVLLGWQQWEERETAGMPWHFVVAALQCLHRSVAGASTTGREGGGGCGRAVAFLGARLPRGNGVGELQWAVAAPKWRVCRGLWRGSSGAPPARRCCWGVFGARRRCCSRDRHAVAGLWRSSLLGGRDRQCKVGVHVGPSSGADTQLASGVDEIPVEVRRGEERAVGIDGNEEKERRERASSSDARWHNPPPLVDDEGVEGRGLRN